MSSASLRIERARAFDRYSAAVASHSSEQTAQSAAALEHARRVLDDIDVQIESAAGRPGRDLERRG